MEARSRQRLTLGWRMLAVLCFTFTALAAHTVDFGTAATSTTCGPDVVRTAAADAWVDQGSPQTNKGSDSILKVRSQAPSGNFRALVRFALPAVPAGCVVESATLRMYAASADGGRIVTVRRLASSWTEGGVNWNNQPAGDGDPVSVTSGPGWRTWNVTAQVTSMYGLGNLGFLVRDAAEGQSGEQQFHSREKGSNVPQLVLRFGTAPASPPPALECGAVVTQSATLTTDLLDCPSHGLVIGAADITLDLGGRTVDGRGVAVGILNEGFDGVTIRNGTVRDFDHGVRLAAGADRNVAEGLTVALNELAGIELVDAGTATAPNRIQSNTIHRNGNGLLVQGGGGNLFHGNDVSWSANRGIVVEGSSSNRLEANRIGDASDLGVLLDGAHQNALVGNTFAGIGDAALRLVQSDDNIVSLNQLGGSGDGGVTLHASDGNTVAYNTADDTSDAAYTLEAGSDDNVVEGNRAGGSTNDDAFRVYDSHRNRLLDNVAHGAGDSGIFLARSHDNVIQGNDLQFNVGGIELDASNGNRIEGNDASHSGAIAIEISDSLANTVVANAASSSGARGIEVTGAAPGGEGNLLEGNFANSNNGSGIVVSAAGHTLKTNLAKENNGWGIHVPGGTIDGGGNRAFGNGEAAQCFGIVCLGTEAEPAACDGVTLWADADAWIDQNSAQTNKGSDSILKIRSLGPSNNFRALVRFPLPSTPAGCTLQSATLRLHASSDDSYGGRTLEARRVASPWTEDGVTWAAQPSTDGDAATVTSGGGYREWTVTAQVAAMLAGANHGFLIRDAVEGQTGEQQLHSREKGTFVPELVLRWAAAG